MKHDRTQTSSRVRLTWLDLFAIVLMSVEAPWIAAYIHSACVFKENFRLYNAEIGGAFFRDYQCYGVSNGPLNAGDIMTVVGDIAAYGVVTFLILLTVKKLGWPHWLIRVCCIAAWTSFFLRWKFQSIDKCRAC